MIASTPYWQRILVLAPVIVVAAGVVFGVVILLGRAFAESVRESGHKRLIYTGLGVLVVAVVVMTYFGVKLPKGE